MKKYIEKIKKLRVDNKLKQSDVAKGLNISTSCYSNYEQGIRELPLDVFINICNLYKISANYLLDIEYD